MTDTQLLVLSIAIVSPLSVLIFQIGVLASHISRVADAIHDLKRLDLKTRHL